MSVRKRRLSDEEVIKHQIELSDRHRSWGFNCPMTDIDFLVVEYDHATPKALIEYKHEKANIDFTNLTTMGMAPHSYEALNKIANAAKIPFFVVKYNSGFSTWAITPMNSLATSWSNYLKIIKNLTEEEYKDFLYFIRDRELPQKESLSSSNNGTITQPKQCPHCGCTDFVYHGDRRCYQCKECGRRVD